MIIKLYGKCVVKLDKNNNVIEEYRSMNEASFQNGLTRNAVRNCLNGRSKSSGGYKWAYKKDVGIEMEKVN